MSLLFDPARLATRFALFEAVCLPSLAAQNPDHFAAVILTSSDLPPVYKDRLLALTAELENIDVVFRPPGWPGKEFSDALVGSLCITEDEPPLRATLRLDDDDALSSDFTDYMQEFLVPGHEGYAITFPSGFVLDLRSERIGGWEIMQYCHSVGLALVSRRPWKETAYTLGNHTSVTKRFRTIADASRQMFVRVRHGHNDDNIRTQEMTFNGSDEALKSLGDGRFGFLDPDALRRAQAMEVRPEGA
jgi:hypothetical protein